MTNQRGRNSRAGYAKFGAFALAVSVAILSSTMPASTSAGETRKLVTEIHFDPGSIDVTVGGRQKIEAAIAKIKHQNPKEILVIGFTDSTGPEDLNRSIARNRASNVAELLMQHGITAPMSIEGKGEKGAPYKIPDDVSEPLNRCVGIIAIGTKEEEPVL